MDAEINQPNLASKEHVVFQKGLVALQARFLLGGEALNPEKLDLSGVRKDQLADFQTRDYQVFKTASLNERIRTASVEKGKLTEAVASWAEKVASLVVNNSQYHQALSKILGIEAKSANQQQFIDLYQRYFSGRKSDVKLFVNDILTAYDNNLIAVSQNLEAIQWLANIFGATSSEVVAQLVDAEVKLQTQPDKIISEVNTNNRINKLLPKEKELLEFVWRERLISQEKTTEKESVSGLEEITEKGWSAYRENLITTSYNEIIEAQQTKMADLQPKAETEPPPLSEAELIMQNQQAKSRVEQLTKDLIQSYGKDKNLPFSAEFSDEKAGMSSMKFNVRGKNRSPSFPLARLYFTVYTRQAPEAFRSLFEVLKQEGVLDHIQLTLNLENYQGSEKDNFQGNTIIIYVPGEKPEVMEKIAKGILKAKQQQPDAWSMSAKDQIKAMKQTLISLKIPLDETTSFVEMDDDRSYDTLHLIALQEELIGVAWDPIFNPYDLERVLQVSKNFTPQNPGLFNLPVNKNRRKYMPGLIFETTPAMALESRLSKEWRSNLIKMEKAGVFHDVFLKRNEVIKKACEGQRPIKTKESERFGESNYYPNTELNWKGHQVVVNEPEIAVKTAEFAAKKYGKSTVEIKTMWQGKDELRNYGANIVIPIAQLDTNRQLTVEDQDWPGTSYGRFLAVRDSRRPRWAVGIKYDIRVAQLYQGEQFYQFIETLIKISEECEIGLSCKDVQVSQDSLSIGNMHLYPHVEANITQEELRNKLMKFYRLSKQSFGDRFRLNTNDLASKNTALKTFTDEEKRELGLTQ